MIRVTLLAENTARGMGVLGEHGLAWWLEAGGHSVLFDTGQGMVIAHNAGRLGVELARAEVVMLSHGHLDHVGGLEQVLCAAPYARVHLHPAATVRRFTGADGRGVARRLSSDFMERDQFVQPGRTVRRSADPEELVPGLWCTGEIPRTNDFEDTGGPFFLDEALAVADPLLDDQALFFQGREGTVVVLGCAHAGVINTLDHVRQLTGGIPIHTVLGGMHLERASERRLAETITGLKRLGVRRLGPNHCTGVSAIARFWQAFPGQVFQCSAGMRMDFAQTGDQSAIK